MTASAGGTPDRDDPTFAPFWTAADEGRIQVQRCGSCGRLRWPPRPMCAHCQESTVEWVDVPPHGTLFSWVDVRHQTTPGVPPPYTIALVQLDGGVRLLGRLVDVSEARIGMPLTARFEPSVAGVTLVNWGPAAEGGDAG